MSIRVHELNHVALHVLDLERSIHFYENIIGLPRLPRPNFNFPGAWFAFGNQELHLIYDETLVDAKRAHHHFALLIDDTFAAKEYLQTQGITEFKGPAPRPDGAMQLFFHDPDGYLIEMYTNPPQ